MRVIIIMFDANPALNCIIVHTGHQQHHVHKNNFYLATAVASILHPSAGHMYAVRCYLLMLLCESEL